VLAIDLGTSGPKAAVIDAGLRVLGWARGTVATHRLPGGGAEQDPEQVWQQVLATCAQALAGTDRRDVAAVICTSQYSSVVPVDAAGVPVDNMILWQDQRGARRNLKQLPGYPRRADSPWDLLRWLRVHGLPPVADGLSLNHMRYLAFGRPQTYRRTATFLEPMDYLTLRLTGRACASQCTALMFLTVDNRRVGATAHDDRLVAASLIDPAKLPELVPANSVVATVRPEVAGRLGLPAGVPVISGATDTQAGAIGAGGHTGGHAVVCLGSTCVLTTHHSAKRTDIRHALVTLPSPVPGTYLVMAENGMAGEVVHRFLHNLVYPGDAFSPTDRPSSAQALHRLAEVAAGVPPGSHGVLFLPWISGSMAPSEDGRMRGGFLNVGATTTRADLARAVLEGLALNLRWMRDPVQHMVKRTFTHYVFYGGGAQSDLWCQIMADALGRPAHQLAEAHLTVARGAAMLALSTLGLRELDGAPAVARVYEPDPVAGRVYERVAPQLVRAHSATRRIVRALATR
jgi:xylulokinase